MKASLSGFLAAPSYAILLVLQADQASAQRNLLRTTVDGTIAIADMDTHSSSGGSRVKAVKERALRCGIDEIIYFNSKFAEFTDLMSNAAEELVLRIEDVGASAIGGYWDGRRGDEEYKFVDFIEGMAADSFTADVKSYRRQNSATAPGFTLSYPSADEFVSGIFTYGDDDGGTPQLPGFYAILPITLGRFSNPNGGASGYSNCKYEDGTAVSVFRTIDIYVAVTDTADVDEDGALENDSATAKVTVTWEKDESGWAMKKLDLVVNELGYTSYPPPVPVQVSL